MRSELAQKIERPVRLGALVCFVAGVGIASAPHAEASPPSKPRARIPTYREMVKAWHTPPEEEEPTLTPEGRPALVLEIINTSERVALSPLRDDGGFTAEDLQLAAHALRDPHRDQERPTDPRVLDLAYQIEMHFQARSLRIVSAFRAPIGRHSRHGAGRAIDLVVPGTPDAEVAQFVRSLGFVGVGLYPRSGFVHVDSRERSYFWIDSSGPGQRGRAVQVYAKAAAAADAQAIERGETPPGQSFDDNETASEGSSDSSGYQALLRRRSSDD